MSAASADPIILADYDPGWPGQFAEEQSRLLEAIGEWAVSIEHVGSTAVPGIAAKPVIDIGVAIRTFEDALLCITPLVELGYRCMGEYGIPGRIFFRKVTETPLPGQTFNGVARTHQIHMYEQGHWQHVAHILFRDWLRTHPESAEEYEALKRELATRHRGDVEAYAEAKSEFIRRVLNDARLAGRPPIIIEEYHRSWPERFRQEKERLLTQIGTLAIQIEHIGSTAVPGLAAKAIIDIMPGVRTLADADACATPMRRLGYEYVPEFELELPGRRYFRKGFPEQQWHVHIVEHNGEFWRRHIAFRDYLRAHPEAVEEYASLKRGLAAQYARDMRAYTFAKSDFILGIQEKAAAAPRPSSPAAERGAPAT